MTDKTKKTAKVSTEKPSKKKAVEVAKKKPLYEIAMWKGVKKVFRCLQCQHCEDRKDDLFLHIASHYPKDEQGAILDRLVKE